MEAESRNSLSDLPDAILLHIFSFLKLKDIVRLRVLSRKFQTLSMKAPSFSFSDYSPRCSCQYVLKFMKNLRRQRHHDLKIDLLSFSSSCTKGKHRKLHKMCLDRLFQVFCVDKLSLVYKLPSIFRSLRRFQSLKVLGLIMTPYHRTQAAPVKLPKVKLASLERLRIMGIETQDSVGVWISESFPSLKCLSLKGVHTSLASGKQLDLTIRSSCLEDLTIFDCCTFRCVRIITNNLMKLGYCSCSGQSFCNYRAFNKDETVVEVTAPNLQSLSLRGDPPRLCYGNMTFKDLQVATITALFHDFDLVPQLFEAIRWAETLSLPSFALRNLYGKPSIPLGDFRHLELCVDMGFHRDNDGVVLADFLERMSNLESLTFVHHVVGPDERVVPYPFKVRVKKILKDCKEKNWKKIKGLKKVKFTIRRVFYSILILIGMMKKSCVDLEEMTVICPASDQKCMERYLDGLETASPSLSINGRRERKRKRDDDDNKVMTGSDDDEGGISEWWQKRFREGGR